MTLTDSFVALVEQLDSGEDTAARDVVRRYSRQLIALTRRQFAPRLAHRIDPEDVVQSVFKSFFVRHREGKIRAANWNALWSLLTLLTRRKCADRVEYLRAARRDVDREATAIERGDRASAPSREPSPLESAVVNETLDRMYLAADGDERPVLELSLQGYSAAEIALQLEMALRTVHRLRERIHTRLTRLQAES
jgi:RNA polymerase sigma-70 factor, ECF subfamily